MGSRGMTIVGHEETRTFEGRRKTLKSLLLASAAFLTLTSVPAIAQQAPADPQTDASAQSSTEGGVTMLDEVLVSSRTGDTALETLGSASHVDQQQLDRRMATTPTDMLFGVPGVTVQTDARRLSASVNIRGLQDFGRVAVILDGARQNFQRSDHGPQSTFWIDPELVKSVDVVRGPIANTYGSGAIGGVVFFDTKDAEDFLRPGETWAVSTTAMYESNGDGATASATGAYQFNDAIGVLGNIVYRDYGDYDAGGGDTVAASGFDVLSGMLKATIKPTENSELKIGWIGADDSWQETSGNQPAYDLDLKQNTFTGRYNVTDDAKSWLDLHINVAYNATEMNQASLIPLGGRFDPVTGRPITLPAGSTANYDIGTTSVDAWNTSRFQTGALTHEVTYGADWVGDDVETTGTAGGDSFYTPSGDRTVWGTYLQDKVTWNWLEVLAGLRYDDYKLKGNTTETSGDHLSPRLSVGVSPFDEGSLAGLQFYGTYAEGYRSPSLSETLISGLHPAGVSFPFLPNPNLKPETGKTFEFGVNYGADSVFASGDALRIKAAYFNNDVDDYIDGVTLSAFDPTSGCRRAGSIPICFQYQNFAKAKIDGFEIESVYDASWGFLGLSASIIDGHTVSYEGERADLATTPSSQVTGQIGFRFLEDRLTIGSEVQYNGKPKGNEFAEDYTLVNAFASYRHNDNLKFDLRVDNLLDEKYAMPLNAASSATLYEPGISVKFGATMRFGG